MKSTKSKVPPEKKRPAVNRKSPKQTELKVSRTHKPDGMELGEWQALLRKQYGTQQNFLLRNLGDHPIFSDFRISNPHSGRTYRVAIRGASAGDNFCTCPDYRINNLGTCKHIEYTLAHLMGKRGAKKLFKAGFVPPFSEVYLRYGLKREVRLRVGENVPSGLLSLAREYFDHDGALKEDRILDFHRFLGGSSKEPGHEVRCRDEVMDFVAEYQDEAHRRSLTGRLLENGIDSAVFTNLLKVPLYPYQREGALFAVTAGRCLIGDDMGLGKTVQALAAAELMEELFGVVKVLIISPTSLKHQWKSEIEKFTDRSAEVVEGPTRKRRELYRLASFYKLINYELVHRDAAFIREWAPDLIILDEAQRIKNWQTRTAKSVKALESTFAIVLTGTPIENRIEELHSIMEFVDRHHLGPLYRFVHTHRVTDQGGKVIGYRDLDSVRNSLKGVMIRRKKAEVLKQLPERVDKNFFVPMTPEQWTIHEENREIVARLVAKWRRYRFLCEADQRRMQIALATMRMASDNTFLVDKKTIFGPKLEELEILLKELVVEGDEKVVIFSQWLRMNELVEGVLARNGIGFVHLNGSVPSKERKGLMTRFREDPECRVFLSTDAGGVGLNLQSGSVVVNMDIPWNPAILEQRIARVHRMGQKKSVRVVNFVSKSSIEERILDLLRFKKSLFAGTLDEDGADTVMVGESQMDTFMRSVEEATESLTRPDAELEQEERREAEHGASLVEEAEAEDDTSSREHHRAVNADVLSDLFARGAEFLAGLSRVVAASTAEGKPSTGEYEGKPEKTLGSLIGKDAATGEQYLKIPLPEPETLARLVSGLGELFKGVMQGKG
jgi:superfamily II DNA or RNA helicase